MIRAVYALIAWGMSAQDNPPSVADIGSESRSTGWGFTRRPALRTSADPDSPPHARTRSRACLLMSETLGSDSRQGCR